MKKKLLAYGRIVVSVGLLALLFWLMRREIGGIWGTVRSSNLKVLSAALILLLVNVGLAALRMKVVFEGEDLKISLWESIQLTYIGYYFNNFMPTAIGGDVVKAHYAARHNNERIKSYASVFMDRFIGLYAFMLVAAVALIIDRGKFEGAAVRVVVYAILFIGVVAFVVAVNKRIARFMERFFARFKMSGFAQKLETVYGIIHDYRNRRTIVAKSFVISLIGQCIYFIAVYLVFISVGTKVNFGNVLLIMPVVSCVSMAPSMGGMGVRESAIVMFFTPLVGKESAFAVSLLLLSGYLFLSVIGGVVYLWWGISHRGAGSVVNSEQ